LKPPDICGRQIAYVSIPVDHFFVTYFAAAIAPFASRGMSLTEWTTSVMNLTLMKFEGGFGYADKIDLKYFGNCQNNDRHRFSSFALAVTGLAA